MIYPKSIVDITAQVIRPVAYWVWGNGTIGIANLTVPLLTGFLTD